MYMHSRLAAQSTHALLCLGYWSHIGLIKTEDIRQVAKLLDVVGGEELVEGWDTINFNK